MAPQLPVRRLWVRARGRGQNRLLPMMRRYRVKRDGNHSEIVAALRAAGRRVLDLSSVGGGCPDLLVAWGGGMLLMEVKDPRGRNTVELAQNDFHSHWVGHVVVVRSAEEALLWTGISPRRPRAELPAPADYSSSRIGSPGGKPASSAGGLRRRRTSAAR